MSTVNRTGIRKHLRTTLKHSARAVTLGTWLIAGTALAAPPANDDFANAIDLTGTGSGQTGDAVNGTMTGTNNAEATLQTGEPNKSEQEATNTVWFKWTCPADGNLTVTTSGSRVSNDDEWDAVLGIYTGVAVDALTALGGSPQDGDILETMTVPVTAGTTYRVQTSGFKNAVAANILLTWNLVPTIYPADILTFGPGAAIGEVVDNAATIAWAVPFGTNLAALAPTFTLSPGATCKVGGSPVVSGTPVNFSGGPVVFSVTAKGIAPIVNNYTVAVTVAPDESALIWNTSSGDWDFITANWLGETSGNIQPFANALNAIFNNPSGGTINIPSPVHPLSTTVSATAGTYTFSGQPIARGPFTKSGGGTLQLKVTPANFSSITVNGGTLYLFAAESGFAPNGASFNMPDTTVESGGTLVGWRANAAGRLTMNGGRYWEDNGWSGSWTGPVYLAANSFFGRSDWYCYNLTINGEISGPGGLTFDSFNNNSTLSLSASNIYTGPTVVNSGTLNCNNIAALGNGGALSIKAGAKVNLNYAGEHHVASLTLGGVPQPGGTHGSSASGATFPNDTYFVGTGKVTVPASSEKNMLTFSFGALGFATIGDTTITLEVPFGTNRANLAPTYTVSAEATGSPPSGTLRNFTGPQTYTVTAQDLSTKEYTVTVTEAVLPDIFTWATATSGNWSVPANWTNEESLDTAPLAGGRKSYTLNFDKVGTYTATNNLAAGFQLNQLNLASAVTLAGNSLAFVANDATLPTINQQSTSPVTISSDMELGSDTTFGGSGNGQVNFTGAISGAGSLTKDGPGVLTINKAILDTNSFSGGTIINSGQLRMNLEATLGTGPITLNGGTIFMWRFYPTNALIVNGGKILSENGFGNRWDGPITLNADFICDVYYPFRITGNISGTGGLTKNIGVMYGNDATLTLSGTNTYTGPTTVTGGTLKCDNIDALGGGALSISSGAKVNLNYSGTKTVASLTLGGVAITAPGTYGSVASGATFPDDSYFTGTGMVAIGGGSDYDTWLGGFTFAPGADTTPGGDPDGDGMTNRQEYAFGLNPTLGSSVSPIAAQLDKTTGNFQYTRRATPAATKLTYTVLTSSDLANWATGGATETGFTTAANIETVTVKVTAPPVGGKLFVRVVATPTP